MDSNDQAPPSGMFFIGDFNNEDIVVIKGVQFAGAFFNALGIDGLPAGRLLQIVKREHNGQPWFSIWPAFEMECQATQERAAHPAEAFKPGFYWRKVVDGTPCIEPCGGPFSSNVQARADAWRQLSVGDDFAVAEWVQVLPENYADDQIDMDAFIGCLNARLAQSGLQAPDCQFSWRDEEQARKDLARLMHEFIRVEVRGGGMWVRKSKNEFTNRPAHPVRRNPQEDAK